MIRTRFGGTSWPRAALATLVVVDLFSYFFFVGDARAVAMANGMAVTGFTDLVSRLPMRAAIVLIGIGAAVVFGTRPGRLWEGALALAALAVLSTAHAQLFGSPWRHLFFSGLCLLGWLLGLAVSRHEGAPTDESWARVGSMALLGAAYLNSGISKIVFGGVEWVSGLPVQVAIIGQDGLVPDGIVARYRSWVVTTPEAARAFSVATLGFELAGPLMLVGRTTRFLVAMGLLAMHTNIYLLTRHILYWESMVLLALFAFSSDGNVAETGSTTAPIRWIDRRFVGSATLLALCALLAIGHQTRRYAHSREKRSVPVPKSAPGPSEAPSAPSSPRPSEARGSAPSATPPLRHVGPFTVGQRLAGEWSIEALDLSDAGLIIALSGTPGRVRFELTCARSEHRSPFDVGAAHLFYSSNDLSRRELEAVGEALRERVRQSADPDICAAVVSWRRSVQSGPQH